jgi:hypothetical protein
MADAQSLSLGIAHARPTDANEDEAARGAAGAYVQVCGLADGSTAFAERVRLALAETDYELIDLDNVRRFEDAIREEELSTRLLELANAAALENATLFGTFHIYETAGDEGDAAPAAETVEALLEAAIHDEALVGLRRAPVPDDVLEGFVVGADLWIMLHKTTDYLTLDGYATVPAASIVDMWFADEVSAVVERVLARRGESAQPIEIRLDSARGVLEDVASLVPLVTVFVEHDVPDGPYVGRLASLHHDTFTLRPITPAGDWSDEETFEYSAVTRIDFGGKYEDGLALVAPAER